MKSETHSRHYEDENLVRRASSGNLDAFNELVLEYQNLVYHQALSVLGDPSLAEDAAQDSFVRAFQSISGFRGGSFRAWMLKIVTNTAYDVLRRLKRRPAQPLFSVNHDGDEVDSSMWLADTRTSVQEEVEQNEFTNSIQRLLDDLPDVYRRVITLIDIYEMDYAEAADVLDVPLGTVKSRLARARFRISEEMRKVENRQLCLYRTA
jgi:RNA polymerase sigma-70 factor (ECF subfamily)